MEKTSIYDFASTIYPHQYDKTDEPGILADVLSINCPSF